MPLEMYKQDLKSDNFNEQKIETNLITLSRHVLHSQKHHDKASGDLTLLLVSIQVACKFISSQVRQAGLANLTGLAGSVNVQGEEVKRLDVVANDIFINCLKSSGKVSVLVSEENENAIMIEDPNLKGKYCVVFDPLDGSSNIDAGVSIGTIFGIYHVKDESDGTIDDVLRPGREMVAAGYAMYGSFTILVLATSEGVNGFTLDPNLGEFILTNPNISIPNRGKIYSVNEGNTKYWYPECQKYFDGLKNPENPASSPYSLRYVGSMVADVHRTLLYGGIFAYPADQKSKSGKLRLLYECFPMAFVMEHAGGYASTGTEPILDINPSNIHARSPIFLGSKDDVQDFEKLSLSLKK